MIGWMLSQIPLWVYVTVTLLVSGVIFYFFSPIIMGIWSVLPRWAKGVLIATGALISAYVAGMTMAGRAAKREQQRREAAANSHREELHREIEKRSDTTIDRDFDKWVR